MGQGTDSCGGYGLDYWSEDEVRLPEIDIRGRHTQLRINGKETPLYAMTPAQLAQGRKFAFRKYYEASNDTLIGFWDVLVRTVDAEIARRPKEAAPSVLPSVCVAPPTPPKVVAPARGNKITMVCHCGTHYDARTSDVARGWGLSCSKPCAAVRRERGLAGAVPAQVHPTTTKRVTMDCDAVNKDSV